MKNARSLIYLFRFEQSKISWLGFLIFTLMGHLLPGAFDFRSNNFTEILAKADSLVEEVNASPLRMLPLLEDREAWRDLESNYNLEALLVEARRLSHQDHEGLNDSYERAKRMRVFSLAEAFTDKGEFIDDLQHEISTMLREPTWVLPAHDFREDARYNRSDSIDLMAVERAWDLAVTAGVYENRLDPETLSMTRRTLRHRIIDPFVLQIMRGPPYSHEFWWLTSTNNWNPVLHAGILGTGLQILKSREERALLIAGIQQNYNRYLDGYEDDGYCSEGLGYWNYGFKAYSRMAIILREHTHSAINLLEYEKVQAISQYPQKLVLLKNTYPAYSDADLGLAPFRYNANTSPSLGFSLIDPGIIRLIDAKDESASVSPLPLRDAFHDSGVYVMRDFTPLEFPMALSIKTGHNDEHHNHNDVGSFTFALGHMSLVLDPGREVYTERTFSSSRYQSDIINSFGHPVPLIDHNGQGTGRNFYGKLLSQSASAEKDVMLFSLREAYDAPNLKKLLRTVVFKRGQDRHVEITDVVAFEKQSHFETALITYADVKMHDLHSFTIQSGSYAIRAEVFSSGTEVAISTSQLEVVTPTGRQPTRIALRAVDPVLSATIGIRWKPIQPKTEFPATINPSDLNESLTIRLQAESFNEQKNGDARILEKVASENLSISHWDKPQHSITWTFNIPESGEYAMRARYCHPLPADILRFVQIDNSKAFPPFTFPGASGWSHYADNWETVIWTDHEKPRWIFLNQGQHTLSITADGNGLALDWIEWLPRNKSLE